MYGNSYAKPLSVARQESTRRTRVLAGCILSLALAAVIAGKPAANSQWPPPSRTKGDIHNVLSKLCLQPEGASTQLGATIVQMPCDGSAAQQWKSVPAPKAGWSHYVNQLSGLCLDAQGGAANETPIQQWTCDQITNEYWTYTGGPRWPVLYSGVANTGYGGTPLFCLDMPYQQTTVNLKMWLYTCNGTMAQGFLGP